VADIVFRSDIEVGAVVILRRAIDMAVHFRDVDPEEARDVELVLKMELLVMDSEGVAA